MPCAFNRNSLSLGNAGIYFCKEKHFRALFKNIYSVTTMGQSTVHILSIMLLKQSVVKDQFT